MLKYTLAAEEGTFSPSHKQDKTDTFMKEALESHNPKGKTKLLMKKRARQKRHEYSLFPPITQTTRKDTQTSFNTHNTHNEDNELALVNGHTISRLNDVTTPYVMHSNYSHKIDNVSPVPNHTKELTRISQMSNGNVIEVQRIPKEHSFTYENKHASSPYIERTDRKPKTDRHQGSRKGYLSRSYDNEKNPKLLLNTNKIGLVERIDRNRYREVKNPKAEENFSIRKKIEQFRKWHEKEMIKDKLDKYHKEVDDQFDADKRKLSKPFIDVNELPDVFSPKSSNNHKRKTHDTEKGDKVRKDSGTHGEGAKRDESTGPTEVEKSPSEQTWRTWRDVNDSYAYTDVKKYIRDNELMGNEKEEWIKKWVLKVNAAMESDSIEGSVT